MKLRDHIAPIATIIGALIGAAAALLAATISRPSFIAETVTKTTTITQTVAQAEPVGATKPTGSAARVYLATLQPTGGDTPMRGDTQFEGVDFPHSIFFENVGALSSNAPACQNAADNECRVTDYDISSGRYHTFSADVGVSTNPSVSGAVVAHWSITVGGVVVKTGQLQGNSQPQHLSISLPSGSVLELLLSSNDQPFAEPFTFVWGNARLS